MLVFLINLLLVLAWALATVSISILITDAVTTGNMSVAATLLVAMLCTLASFSYNMVLKK